MDEVLLVACVVMVPGNRAENQSWIGGSRATRIQEGWIGKGGMWKGGMGGALSSGVCG